MDYVVVDLDGTLCDSRHREHLVEAKEWDAFNQMSEADEPWPDVAEFVRAMDASAKTIIACTGRSEKVRQITIDWLEAHDIPCDHLLMRPEHDYRSDTEVKGDLLYDFFEAGEDHLDGKAEALSHVLVILEDRDKMVEFWRNEGFQCWQVRTGGW